MPKATRFGGCLADKSQAAEARVLWLYSYKINDGWQSQGHRPIPPEIIPDTFCILNINSVSQIQRTDRYRLTAAHDAPICAPFNIPIHELKIARYSVAQATLEAYSQPHQRSAGLASFGSARRRENPQHGANSHKHSAGSTTAVPPPNIIDTLVPLCLKIAPAVLQSFGICLLIEGSVVTCSKDDFHNRRQIPCLLEHSLHLSNYQVIWYLRIKKDLGEAFKK